MSETADANKLQNCPYCGNHHPRTVCPLVKVIEYHPNGTLKRVEFHGAQPFRLNDILVGASPQQPGQGK